MRSLKSTDPEEQQFVFKGPERQHESQPIVDLPGVIAIVPGMPGVTEFCSMWEPDAAELALLNAGHKVIVGILNNGAPIHPFYVGVSKHPTAILE